MEDRAESSDDLWGQETQRIAGSGGGVTRTMLRTSSGFLPCLAVSAVAAPATSRGSVEIHLVALVVALLEAIVALDTRGVMRTLATGPHNVSFLQRLATDEGRGVESLQCGENLDVNIPIR